MEKEERNNCAIAVFADLMKTMIITSFVFPKGVIAKRNVSSSLDSLEFICKGEVSRERIIDYCICKVYAISRFGQEYIRE